jgi:hypothetical protein
MFVTLLTRLTGAIHHRVQTVRARVLAWTAPATSGQALGTLADLVRSRPELVAENALLRQQLIVLRRSVARPKLTRADRVLLVLLAAGCAPVLAPQVQGHRTHTAGACGDRRPDPRDGHRQPHLGRRGAPCWRVIVNLIKLGGTRRNVPEPPRLSNIER